MSTDENNFIEIVEIEFFKPPTKERSDNQIRALQEIDQNSSQGQGISKLFFLPFFAVCSTDRQTVLLEPRKPQNNSDSCVLQFTLLTCLSSILNAA